MKKTLLALAVLGLAYVGAAWTTGRMVERQLDAEMAKVSSLLPSLKPSEDVHTRGLFGSTRSTTYDVSSLWSTSECPQTPQDSLESDAGFGQEPGGADEGEGESLATAPKPAAQPGLGLPPPAPLLITVQQKITHGPLPGFGLPAAAAVRYRLLINGKPASEALPEQIGLSTEGELPVLSARYGFTGNSHFALEGESAKLVLKAKDDPTQLTVSWPSLRLSGDTARDLSRMRYDGRLPALTVDVASSEGETLTLTLKDLAITRDHRYPTPGQLFVYTGTDTFQLASLSASQGGKTVFEASGLSSDGNTTLEAGLTDSTAKIALAQVKTSDTVLGPIDYRFTLARLDAAAYGALMQLLISNDLGRCPTPERTAALMTQLKAQIPALLKAGPEFRIDQLSIGYEGQAANLSGKLTLPAATAEQLENPMTLLPLISASFKLALPDPLIETLAVKAASAQLAQRIENEAALAAAFADEAGAPNAAAPMPPAPATPAQIAEAEAAAKAMLAQQLKQALANNWIVRSEGGISGSLDYRAGAVTLNGKPLDLEGLMGGAAAAPGEDTP